MGARKSRRSSGLRLSVGAIGALIALALWLPVTSASDGAQRAEVDCPGARTDVSQLTADQIRSVLICVVNNERTLRGLAAYVPDPRLQTAAQKTLDGTAHPFADQRIRDEGYDWDSYARLGASGPTTVFETVQAHLTNQNECFHAFLRPDLIDIGVAFAFDVNGVPAWEQIYAHESSDPSGGDNYAPRESCPQSLLGNYGAADAPPIANAAPRTAISKVQFVKFVDPGQKARAKFVFRSSEAGSTFSCRIDSRPFAKCRSPKVYRVGIGKHTFRVRATDASGKADPTPAKIVFRVLRQP